MSDTRAAVARAVGVAPEQVTYYGEYSDGWLVVANGVRYEHVEVDEVADGAAADSLESLGINDQILGLLEVAGYETAGQVRLASDDELRAVKGIGPASLRAIREATE